ncbi:hypothetical protein L3Q82_008466 [Scortum barcoo]|uniref:Uncharacterized protein n=1 Tax=Scortum barcoo TaxID=214431 RepID=A0ACB8XGE5_9TELE|nr:hypothetical protein L3Q82_008466 [Scortum barcoo]
MERSFESKNGHLDLFVRFLHGLSLESNQRLLGGLLGRTDNSPEIIQKAISNLKGINRDEISSDRNMIITYHLNGMDMYWISPERSINIFHCLMEMNDHSVHQEIQEFLKSENRSEKKLSEIHCSALAYMLQMSEEVLDELDLNEVQHIRSGTTETGSSCEELQKGSRAGAECQQRPAGFRSEPNLLSTGLESPNCKLETLKLRCCSLSEISCASLASALKSNPSHLRELELSFNKLQGSGVKLLCGFLESPHCRLQTLRSDTIFSFCAEINMILRRCSFSEISCVSLAFSSEVQPLPSERAGPELQRAADSDSGVKLLLRGCSLSEISCDSLAFSSEVQPLPSERAGPELQQQPAGFRSEAAIEGLQVVKDQLCFSGLSSEVQPLPSERAGAEFNNKLQDSGVKLLCGFSGESTLLRCCWLSEISCASLASALKSNPSHLRELDLSDKKLQDSGVNLLCGFLESPQCRLQTLRLRYCRLSEVSCVSLVLALKSNPSHLRELDLSHNDLKDSGVRMLADLLESPHCRLQTLRSVGRPTLSMLFQHYCT